MGLVSSSGSPRRFLLLWTHYGRTSHMYFAMKKPTEGRKFMDKKGCPADLPAAFPALSSVLKCFPPQLSFLTKLMICLISHLPCPAHLASIPGYYHITVSFASTRTLTMVTSPIAHMQGREGPLGACFLMLERFSGIYYSVAQCRIAQHNACTDSFSAASCFCDHPCPKSMQQEKSRP